MTEDNGIFLDLFPPISWQQQDILTALEIADEADGELGWKFTLEEMAYLAKTIAYYMSTPPTDWQGTFEIDTDVDFEDPDENGRFIINMSYPSHLEPPANLR